MNTAEDLIEYLAPELDEVAVLSVVSQSTDGQHRLLKASCLIGPEAMAQGNWSQWQRNHAASNRGLSEPDSNEYATSADGLLTARAAIRVEHCAAWIQSLIENGEAESVGHVPAIHADLERPEAPVRMSRWLNNDSASFVSAAVRPCIGFHLRASEMDFELPGRWRGGNGEEFTNSPLAAGLLLRPGSPGGLVVARLERRAWFSAIRGREDLATFDLSLGLEPNRIDIADLVVTLDEWVSGELVHSQQVRLEHLEVDHVRGEPNVVIALPTLGPQVQRSARLHDREGRLLDMTGFQFSIVEAIKIDIGVMGADETETVQIGDLRTVPPLVKRAQRVARVRQQYETMFSEGAEAILLPAGTDVRRVLAERLAQARGILRIVDRYFGQHPADYRMLAAALGPIEVLTSRGAAPPAGSRPDLTVRWLKGRRPPFHGRAYLWDQGGFSVDASPDGFGRDIVSIMPLSNAVSNRWQQAFSVWWALAQPHP